MNKVWTRICPILGLLLLLSVCPLLSDICEYQENSDDVFFQQNQAKCISGSNSFPEGHGSIPNVDLNKWFEGKGEGRKCCILTGHKNSKYGKFGRTYCQEQGNSFSFSSKLYLLHYSVRSMSRDLYEPKLGVSVNRYLLHYIVRNKNKNSVVFVFFFFNNPFSTSFNRLFPFHFDWLPKFK